MTAATYKEIIVEGIEGLPADILAEVADFVLFVRRKSLPSQALEEEAPQDALAMELKRLSRAEVSHLEDEWSEHDSGARLIPVQATSGVMGGDYCIRETRIPVWLLVQYKRQGLTDSELLQAYPGLNAADLVAAWDFYAANAAQVERQMSEHEETA